MMLSVATPQLSLDSRQIVLVRDGLGARVICMSGVVWITQEGDLRDTVLHGGGSFVLDRHGVALITAIQTSRIRVEEAVLAAA